MSEKVRKERGRWKEEPTLPEHPGRTISPELWDSVNELLIGASANPAILQDFLELVVREFSDGAIIDLRGLGADTLEFEATAYKTTLGDREEELRRMISKGLSGQLTSEACKLGDARFYDPTMMEDERLDALSVHSALILPIGSRKKVLGTLTLMATQESTPGFTSEDLGPARGLASRALAAVVCHNVAREKLQEAEQAVEYAAELKHLLAMKETVAESLGEGAVAVDADGKVTFINSAALTALKVQSEDVLGKCFHEVVHPPEICVEREGCCLWHGLSVGADIRSHNDNFYRGGGEALPVSITLTQVASGSDVVIVFRDMSEYRDMQVRLMSTDRMTAVGTLAAGIAHEINNPLAFVQSNVKFVHQRLGSTVEEVGEEGQVIKEALTDAMEGVERIRAIVAGMRTFTGDGKGETLVNAEECLQNALTVCRGDLRTRANVVRCGESLGWVRCNLASLTQVFVNLLMNASFAVAETGEFGEIVVESGYYEDRQFVEFQDNGVGITEEMKKQIFDPFFTTREVGDGTGLGLYICRAILREVHGDISLTSTPGEGATFRVELPRLNSEGKAILSELSTVG